MTQEVKLRRVKCNYQTENARFLLECDFSKQYNNYYRKRLEKTRPYLEYNARSKWDPLIPIYSLAEIATFSMKELLDDSDLALSPTRMTPPRNQDSNQHDDLGTPSGGGYHKFPKRIRKISTSSATNIPKSSTQNDPNNPESDMADIKTSPILRRGMSETPHARMTSDSEPVDCIVIGTIFKRMKLQPDVVEELSKGDFHVKCERYLGHYTSPDDTLVLEDTEESISLVGNINPGSFVTGICVALLGYSIGDGSQFLVKDICYAEPNRQILYDDLELSHMSSSSSRSIQSSLDDIRGDCSTYLMVVSGLGFHHEMEKKADLTQALQNMIDFVWGGGKYSDDERSHQVARILVVGDSLHEDRLSQNEVVDDSGVDPDDVATKMKQSRQVKPYSRSISAVKHMDDFFAQLSKTIYVDVMPGPSDPSFHLMPQQPFHPCMFPKSCMFSTFNCTTNPHHAIYDGHVEVLATAGQNVDIIEKFSGLKEPVEIMKNHLRWGNSAPSAPDNLYSVPYENEDPYVIDFIPDIYIAGCQDEFKQDYHYYKSNVLSQAQMSEQVSVASSKTESTVINVTADSIRERATMQALSQQLHSTPKSPRPANELAEDASDGIQLEGTPSDYVPNQLALQRRTLEAPKKSRTLLLTIPKFHKSLSCVLINLRTMTAEVVSFG